MKRIYSGVLALMVAMATLAAPALAAPRAPQIAFGSGPLQARLNGFGESINVLTQQQEGLVWGSTISTNSTMTIQFELSGNPHHNEIGIAKLNAGGNAVTGLVPVFTSAPGSFNNTDTGWFAVASFRPGNLLVVNLFDQSAALRSITTVGGVDRTHFAYYLSNSTGTFYSHDGFNLDLKAHALAYMGNGQNTGGWWLCWEDAPIVNYANADFDDATVFMESLNPTPVSHTTWGKVKSRFR